MKHYAIAFLFLISSCTVAHQKIPHNPSNIFQSTSVSTESENRDPDVSIDILSYHYGYLQGKQFDLFGTPCNMDRFIEGMQAARKGEISLYSDQMIEKAYSSLKIDLPEKQKKVNLQIAEKFLNNIAKNSEITELLPGKLYYQTLVPGSGASIQESALVEGSFNVLVLETSGKEKLIENLSQQNVEISIADTIPGVAKGLHNMHIGERRKIFIHPDLAYGTYGGRFEPNQLIIFEIEISKVLLPKETTK